MFSISAPRLKLIAFVSSVMALVFPLLGRKLGLSELSIKHAEIAIVLLSLVCGGVGIILGGELTLSGRFGGSMVIGRRHSRMIGSALLISTFAVLAYASESRFAIPGTLLFSGAAATVGSLALSFAYGERVGSSGYAAFAVFVMGGVFVTLLGIMLFFR